MTPQRDNRVTVSALFRAGPKVNEVANLVGVSRTIVYAIQKRMDDSECVNGHIGRSRKLMWILTACGIPPLTRMLTPSPSSLRFLIA